MSERYKCARCGNRLTVVPDDVVPDVDGCYAVHPCARCTPHPALAASAVAAEDFADLRCDVDVLMARVAALEAAQWVKPTPVTEPGATWSGLYGVRSTPQQVTQTAGDTGEEGA